MFHSTGVLKSPWHCMADTATFSAPLVASFLSAIADGDPISSGRLRGSKKPLATAWADPHQGNVVTF